MKSVLKATMIQLDLSPEVERQVIEAAVARSLEPTAYVSQLVTNSVAHAMRKRPSPQEFRAALDRMAELGKDAPTLSEYALTRESFYEDHD